MKKLLLLLPVMLIFLSACGQNQAPAPTPTTNNEVTPPVSKTAPPTPTNNETADTGMPRMSYKIIKSNCEQNNTYTTISLLADDKEVTVLKTSLCEVTQVIFRSGNSDVVYFSVEPGGLGGYYVYAPVFNLYKLDLKNKTASLLTSSIANLDFNGDLTQAIIVTSDTHKVTVKNLSNNSDQAFGVLPVAEQGQIGNVKFSPDFKKAAFALGYGPSEEYGEIYVLDLSTKKFSLYKKLSSGHVQVNGWKNNEEVDWSPLQ